ncbi:MAG: NYN domain-containing protein, partial [Fidelibacterota bacterium]
NIWLDALKSFDIIEIFKGFYLSKPVTCKNCGHTFTKMEEKKTDVNISVQMLTDCFQKKVDVIFLVTGDTDLVPPLKMIRKNFPHIWIIILSPPKRQNNELKDKSISHHYLTIGKAKIRKYQLSNTITLKNGVNISKPEEWSDPES